MSNYDFKSAIQAISDASPSHLALVSFLVLPIVMNNWLETIIQAFPKISTYLRIIALVALLIIYMFCLFWLIKENNKRNILKNRKDKIIGTIMSRGYTKIGFDRLDKIFTPELTIEEITEVIDTFPKSLRFVRLTKKYNKEYIKDKAGNKTYRPGVGLVKLKDDPNDPDT